MPLIRKEKRRVLWRDFEKADNFLKRLIGIMFRRTLDAPMVFYFNRKGRHAIHSCFCASFDAIYLDEKKKVVDVRDGVPPFTLLVTPKKDALFLIEAPAGSARELNILEGDVLAF
ncbi:DUF192 domain-containing protein [Candidatus Micrarchaeota archaeon]|nr:DUF192 domain-containing protein [Candidatus Micrarchaeota archaeon]